MAKFNSRVSFDTIRELGFASIGANYALVGTPFDDEVCMLAIINTTDQDLYLSDDGINNKIYLPTQTARIYDFASNKSNTTERTKVISDGSAFFVKHSGVAPLSGSIFIETVS